MAISYDPITDRIIVSANPGMDVTLPFKMRANYGAAAATSPDADWLARSTTQGVAWAHDFTSPGEVFNFVDARGPGFTSGLQYNTAYTHNPTGGITGGSMDVTFPANPISVITTMANVDGTHSRVTTTTPHQCSVGQVVLFGFHGQPVLPAPWNDFNETEDGGGGQTRGFAITAVNSATSFDISNAPTPNIGVTPNTTGRATYSGGAAQMMRRTLANGNWIRPMSALSSGNGLAGADRGVNAPELLMPGRSWSLNDADINRWYNWRKDFYGNAAYASRLAVWPDSAGNNQTNQYRGADYWIQFRAKLPLASVQASNAGPSASNSRPVKMIWCLTTWTTPAHEIVFYDNNTVNSPYANWSATDGGIPYGYSGAGQPRFYEKPGTRWQPGGDYDATCRGPGSDRPTALNACWHYPHDEWVCYLMHIIPGQNLNWAGWPVPSDPTKATGIQLWACSQTRINIMRSTGNGVVTYEKIWDATGAEGYPMFFENADPNNFLNGDAAPAYNAFSLTSYQNSLPFIFGFTRQYTQLIFKRGNGGNNPVTDGIPCPQV